MRYSAERLVKLGQTAAAPDSPFSLSDRIGLVWDAFALAKAGYAPVSSAFGLISMLRDEKECKWRFYANDRSVMINALYRLRVGYHCEQPWRDRVDVV